MLHSALALARQPDRGREFVCTAKEGLAAGVCVLVEEPVVSVLDTEVQREKQWWGLHSEKSVHWYIYSKKSLCTDLLESVPAGGRRRRRYVLALNMI